MNSKSLIKKSGVYLIGNLSSKIMSALLIPIYAFYIHTDDLGYFDTSQTFMGILTPLILLAIWEAILKFVLSEDDEERKQKIITTSALFTIIMSVFFSVVIFILCNLFEYSIKYLFLITMMIILNSIVYVWQYFSRGIGKNKLYVIAGIFSTVINFISIIILVVILNKGLLGLLLAYILGQLSLIIVIERDIKVLKKIKFKDFDFRILKKMLRFSSPLVLNLMSAWLLSGFGRLIITFELGTEANGGYSFANKFSLLITMIGTVITMALIEEAIISVKNKGLNTNINKTMESLFKGFQNISLLAVPLIVVFYAFLSSTSYYYSLEFVPWLLLYAVFNTMAVNIGSIFQAVNKTKYQFFTTFLGGIVTVIISISFIKEHGVIAVIFGQILGAITMMITRYNIINKFVDMKINWKPIIFRTFIFIVISILCIGNQYFISLIFAILIIMYFYYENRQTLNTFLKKIK